MSKEAKPMEIAVKATYAHLVKDESLVQNSDKLYIVEFHFMPNRLSLKPAAYSSRLWR